ncbi:PfkB family carbohydrate kinase [uncultured Amnibacterium sp.]|uniref:PfkB family carbohydrate kinase n=1 Tax=uncultured Amnibacterium sp. TaxID=1631851 RepID=UPI0035CC051B
MSGRVVTIGNAMIDVIAAAPHLPRRGGDVLATAGRLEVGGGGFRTVAAARAAGAPALYAGRIGTGVFADLARRALADAGIPAPLPPVPDRDTGYVLTVLEPDGERTFLTVPGAEATRPELGGLVLDADDVVHVHGYGLVAPGRGAAIARFVESLGPSVRVLLDPGPFGADADPEVLARLLPRLDWWSGNDAEARAATGLGDPVRAALLLAGTVRTGAVVRLGAEGCVLAVRGAAPVPLRAPAVDVVDTNGAGDTHVGVFLAGLLAGLDPVDAARAANEAAAAFVGAAR